MKLLECLREEVVPPRKEKVVVKVVVKGRRKIRQSGRLQKYSSISVLISPQKSRNIVAEPCQMTDLGAEGSYLQEHWIRTQLPREALCSSRSTT